MSWTVNKIRAPEVAFGLASQKKVINDLKEYFKCDILETDNEFHPYDFCEINGESYYELKTRRCNWTTYPDTMVSLAKKEYADSHPESDFYLCFKFNDGLYAHKYSPRKNNYQVKTFMRQDRNGESPKPHLFIKNNTMFKIC